MSHRSETEVFCVDKTLETAGVEEVSHRSETEVFCVDTTLETAGGSPIKNEQGQNSNTDKPLKLTLPYRP